MPHYFDHNATTPLKPEVQHAISAAIGTFGNPSSVHSFGRAARKLLEDSRQQLASAVGVKPAQIIYTSGGTEANHLALRGHAHLPLLVSAVEHDCVLAARADAQLIPVDANGIVHGDSLNAMLQQLGQPAIVSIMLANNETGVIQPIPQLADIVHQHGGLLHVDAAQGLGKIPVNFVLLGADMLTLSAHKMGGPKGIGALVVGDRIAPTPQLLGGGQEQRRRAGTENLLGIIGFGAAASTVAADLRYMQQLQTWRNAFESQLLATLPNLVVYGQNAPRLPNTSYIGMAGKKAETQMLALDLAGFAVSTGAACSSGKVKPSHVIEAMGFGTTAASEAIRISSGLTTTEADYIQLAAQLVSKS